MADQIASAVSFEVTDGVGVIRVDDGKANALGHEAIDAIGVGLDRAEAEAGAVLLVGREGKFCAGFDLATMTGGDIDATRALLGAGAELSLRLYLHPQPVVMAATGHALALGAILLMAGDVRIGAEGPYKIGTNEVAIGLPVPRFAVALAQDRLSRRHLQQATQFAQVYDPAGAVDAGYLDRVVALDALEADALATASAAASGLKRGAFAATRGYMRNATAEAFRAGLVLDLQDFTVEA